MFQVKVERRHGHGGGRSSEDGSDCHTAVLGEACFEGVRWAMDTGILQHPSWYPNLTATSTFQDFQALLHRENHHHCETPCEADDEHQEFVVAGGKDAGMSTKEGARISDATDSEEVVENPAGDKQGSSERRGHSCWAVEDDFDYPGGNIRILDGVSSVDECCKQCKAEKECRQWTHDSGEGSCMLKHQLQVGRTPKQGLASGLPGHDGTSYLIKSALGECLDAGAANLHTSSCEPSDMQLWVYDRGTGEIYSKHGSCLDTSRHSEGGDVIVRACSPRNSQHQQWEFDSDSRLIRSSHGHCLSVTRHGNKDGRLSLSDCDKSKDEQLWKMVGLAMAEEMGSSADVDADFGSEQKSGNSTTARPSRAPKKNPIFKIIKKGTCEEAGMHPIMTKVTCEHAARLLELADTWATPTNNVERPEGCYMFEMDMLWMGINPKSKGRGWQPYRSPICMKDPPLFEEGMYREQEGAAIAVGGDVKVYGVGSSNLVWMSWMDQMHLYLQRLGYKLPVIEPHAILSRITPRSVPICDDSAYYAKSETARLGMVGWNSWDFAYNDWDDCDDRDFRNISGHKVKCGVGPGCKGGEFLISASSIAEDAAKSNVTIISTWYNDHKAFLTHYDCFDGEKIIYEKTSEVTIPSIMRTIKEIHKKNPYVAILVMGIYPPTLDYKVVEAEVPWIRRLNRRVQEEVEKESNSYFVDYELPGGNLEMYDRVHYGHPNCRGAKVMVYAALRRLYEAKVLARGLREVNPKVNIANPDCHLIEDNATCGTSALCWVDPADSKCKSYSVGHPGFRKASAKGSQL